MSHIKQLHEILSELTPQLPIQNPMPFFVHNNPLQYWEKFNFNEGILEACLLYEQSGVMKDRTYTRELEDIVLPVISGYLDQGLSQWNGSLNENLWLWFFDYIESSWQLKSKSFSKLKKEIKKWSNQSSEIIICSLLEKKSSDYVNWQNYIKSLLFHFKGWSGMINVLEKNPALFPLKVKKVNLIDWLAILVFVDDTINSFKFKIDNEALQKKKIDINNHLENIKTSETKYHSQLLNQISEHIEKNIVTKKSAQPMAQIFFCIDDREESFRRILEEFAPQIETFGTVGFFGIDVSIKSHDQLIYQPFCPPVITPRKKAEEVLTEVEYIKNRKIKVIPTLLNHTRFTFIEPFLSLTAPLFYFSSLLLRSVNSETYSRFKNYFLQNPKIESEYIYSFDSKNEYTTVEKAKIVFDILKSAGLNNNFADIILMMGHGSTTTNNPFQKSYGCGACSGQSGFPNAKIFCSFANDSAVRNELKNINYFIPDNTIFIAAHHDTCSDEVNIKLPEKNGTQSLAAEKLEIINQVKQLLNKALEINIKNRFKKFKMNPKETAKHRALDWSQPRPEFGHSNVALAFFGPRSLTRGFDLDRRSFLISYDPATDKDGSELEYVIMNALPVCANINLDYFTSGSFPLAFGSGSKLPLNIVSGIGLMTGSKSDLRIGLARQMVDQHESLRLMSYICCYEDMLIKTIKKSARLTNLVTNEWIKIIRIDPNDLKLHELKPNQLKPQTRKLVENVCEY